MGWEVSADKTSLTATCDSGGRNLRWITKRIKNGLDLILENALAGSWLEMVFPALAQVSTNGKHAGTVLVWLGQSLKLRIAGLHGEPLSIQSEKVSIRSGTETGENLVVKVALQDRSSSASEIGFIIKLEDKWL